MPHNHNLIHTKPCCFRFQVCFVILFLPVVMGLTSCKKLNEISFDPEIEPLRHGFKTSAMIGYCASLAANYFRSGMVPDNVFIPSTKKSSQTESVLMVVTLNDSYPLPFNSSEGQITIAGIWSGNGGIITALFSDIDILGAKYNFWGIHTIPIVDLEDGNIMTLFAEQDVIMGEGSDTLLHLNMEIAWISLEMERLATAMPTDVFVAAKQNVWFITVNPNNTFSEIYDDEYTLNGGGQIAEVTGSGGGILYHAFIEAKFNYGACEFNPISGIGFIQNLKAGTETDLGHIFMSFHDRCDGKAYIEFATGKYLRSSFKNVNLNFN